MTQNLTTILTQHSEQTKPDTITLWHTSRDVDVLKSFLDEGAKPTGKGLGGQKSGFYVWSKKRSAISHFTDALYEDVSGEGLIIGTKVKKSEIMYPNWQFDIELAAVLNPLLFKYINQITKIKDLVYLENGEKRIIPQIATVTTTSKEECNLQCIKANGKPGYFLDGPHTGGDTYHLNVWQALIDELCKNADFCKDYNRYLQVAATHPTKSFALKYCGKEPLPIDEVSHIQKDAEGNVKETILYTSSVPKEQQVCPFVKIGMTRKKGARES